MIQHFTSPLEEHDPSEPSIFLPRNLLDGARRYKRLPEQPVPVGCLAHVTNAMATRPEDFEKGGRDGQEESLDICARALRVAIAHERVGAP